MSLSLCKYESQLFSMWFHSLSCINEHKNRFRKSFIKANKVLKNGNQVLVHTSTETIFGTDSKNCTYKSLANRYFKALPFKQHRN